jgi:DegT/DnrJ/EryC1/StrS aminotransferase family
MAKDFDGNFTQQDPLRAEAVSPAIEVMNSEAPVPGAIAGAVGLPILVETTRDLVIDGDDLAEKISFSGAKILMLSHMRGHIAGTDALGRLCIPRGVIIIEDCAHTMGTAWGQVKSGRHGRVAGFSTQIYKHMNSGEGGLITSDDPELMARATVLSGYYMLYGRHLAGRPERLGCKLRTVPDASTICGPQFCARNWRASTKTVHAGMNATMRSLLNSRMFRTSGFPSGPEGTLRGEFHQVQSSHNSISARDKARGVEIKWFGASEPVSFTSSHESWGYLDAQSLPNTDQIPATLYDMRLPLTFPLEDCSLIGVIIRECVLSLRSGVTS